MVVVTVFAVGVVAFAGVRRSSPDVTASTQGKVGWREEGATTATRCLRRWTWSARACNLRTIDPRGCDSRSHEGNEVEWTEASDHRLTQDHQNMQDCQGEGGVYTKALRIAGSNVEIMGDEGWGGWRE